MTGFWDDERKPEADLELKLHGVAVAEAGDGSYHIILQSSRGEIAGQLHPFEGGSGAVLFVGGASGGLDGPADGLYRELSKELIQREISSLRLHYRQPGAFEECVLDVLGGVSFMKGIGARRIVLVGHSFGGAVVINAGQFSEAVVAVAALSSQLFGTTRVAELAPRPLLLVHGMQDQVLEATASEVIFGRACEPKQIVLYPEAGHSLIQCKAALQTLLLTWLPAQADPTD